MIKLAQRLEDLLTTLYDYEYIDLERFYNCKYNVELLDILNRVIVDGEIRDEDSEALNELYDSLDSFIKFETNHNSDIGSF